MQNELDMKDMDNNRIKKVVEQNDREIEYLKTELAMKIAEVNDQTQELEMKSGENNRLRNQVAELERTVQDLYCSRKGNGSL